MSHLPEDIEKLIFSYHPHSTISGWVHLWAHTLDNILRKKYPGIPRHYEPTYNIGRVEFAGVRGGDYDIVDKIWKEWATTYEDAIRQATINEHGTESASVGGLVRPKPKRRRIRTFG